MIPDKIYIPQNISRSDVTSLSFPDDKGQGIEFIRKDALMEKLRKAAESYKKRSDEGELVWQNMCGINEAIDILNKM